MKELLLKNKFRFYIYIFACTFPVFMRYVQIWIITLFFEAMGQKSIILYEQVLFYTVIFLVFDFIIFILSRLLRIGFMRDTLFEVRKMAFDKVINASFKNFNKKSKDIYLSNMVNDINTFESRFFLNLINLIFLSGSYLVAMVILLFINYKLALLMISLSIVLFLISKAFESKTIEWQKDVSSESEIFTLNMSNTFNGLEVLKLNNIEGTFLNKGINSIEELEKKKARLRSLTTNQNSVLYTIGYMIFLLMLVFLVGRLDEGVSYGEIALIIQLSTGTVFSLSSILPRYNVLKSSKEIFDKITKDEEEISMEQKKGFEFKEQILVKNMSFELDGKKIFDRVNFKIEIGKKYLIKGVSGAGKSTLMKILSMGHDEYEGEIIVDGVDLKSISESDFYNEVSFVYQDVFIFEDTIRNNIALYKAVDDEILLNSTNKAGLKEFINSRNDGLENEILENGKNLSGGERQRISIARALVRESRILFIDEGTSSLNEELGREIEQAILDLETTVIAISHRYYSGISEKYDYVIEIKNGEVELFEGKAYFREVLYA
ncbi:ABC transporter ATP-binding protein [Mycoplasmatota bacterium zrk1]